LHLFSSLGVLSGLDRICISLKGCRENNNRAWFGTVYYWETENVHAMRRIRLFYRSKGAVRESQFVMCIFLSFVDDFSMYNLYFSLISSSVDSYWSFAYFFRPQNDAKIASF